MENNHNQIEDISNHPLILWHQNYQTQNQKAITYYSAWYPELPKCQITLKNQITLILKTDQIDQKFALDISKIKIPKFEFDIYLKEINLNYKSIFDNIDVCDSCGKILQQEDKTELSRNNIKEFFYSENLKEESKFALPPEIIEKICDYVNLKVYHYCPPKLYDNIIDLGRFNLFDAIPHDLLSEDLQSKEDVIVAQYYPEWHQHESEMQYKMVGEEVQLALPWE